MPRWSDKARCDHADDNQIEALIARVIADYGRIDILINNACAVVDALTVPGQFWEKPLYISNMIDVGVRSSFVASWYAAPHMIKQDKGLVLFTSSAGSMHYCFGPAYGAHKAGVDKMAFDMGVDFADAGSAVAAVSIWMGSLATERLLGMIEAMPDQYGFLRDTLESPDYTGHIAWALYNDPELATFNGKTLIGAEIGKHYGIKDGADDRYPPSGREHTGANPPAYSDYKVK